MDLLKSLAGHCNPTTWLPDSVIFHCQVCLFECHYDLLRWTVGFQYYNWTFLTIDFFLPTYLPDRFTFDCPLLDYCRTLSKSNFSPYSLDSLFRMVHKVLERNQLTVLFPSEGFIPLLDWVFGVFAAECALITIEKLTLGTWLPGQTISVNVPTWTVYHLVVIFA